jgi:hypothetical protein
MIEHNCFHLLHLATLTTLFRWDTSAEKSRHPWPKLRTRLETKGLHRWFEISICDRKSVREWCRTFTCDRRLWTTFHNRKHSARQWKSKSFCVLLSGAPLWRIWTGLHRQTGGFSMDSNKEESRIAKQPAWISCHCDIVTCSVSQMTMHRSWWRIYRLHVHVSKNQWVQQLSINDIKTTKWFDICFSWLTCGTISFHNILSKVVIKFCRLL